MERIIIIVIAGYITAVLLGIFKDAFKRLKNGSAVINKNTGTITADVYVIKMQNSFTQSVYLVSLNRSAFEHKMSMTTIVDQAKKFPSEKAAKAYMNDGLIAYTDFVVLPVKITLFK